MEQLQYDSFYKFIVSIGVILIVAPVIGLYHLVSGSFDIIISKQDYASLSEMSLQFIQNKEKWVDFLFQILPIIFIIVILVGLFCVIWGGIKWYNMQKELDKGVRLDVSVKERHLKDMTPSEVIEKVSKEINAEDLLFDADSRPPQKRRPTHAAANVAVRYRTHLQVEEACFELIKKQLPKNYIIHQNIKINNMEYDIIATSNYDDTDFLYEIKYWQKASKESIKDALNQMEGSGLYYNKHTHRRYQFTLIIVSDSENLKSIQDTVITTMSEMQVFSNENVFQPDIEYIDEKDLRIK